MNEKHALMRILGFLDSQEKYTEIHGMDVFSNLIKTIRIKIEKIIEEEGCDL